MRVGVAGFRDDVHAGALRDVHDGGVLAQAMHEERRHETVARVLRAAVEERAAYAAAAMRGQHRKPELGMVVAQCQVRNPDERQAVVVDGKDGVPIEIDSIDVGGNAVRGERRAESQAPILRSQGEEMREERAARAFVETLNGDGHKHSGEWVVDLGVGWRHGHRWACRFWETPDGRFVHRSRIWRISCAEGGLDHDPAGFAGASGPGGTTLARSRSVSELHI